MREELTLNNNAVNQHAKRLLTQLDPEEPEHLSPNETLPELYLLRLMEWMLEPLELEGIFVGSQQMLLEQVWELKEMPPLQAWKWLNPGRQQEEFQMTEDPEQGAMLAIKKILVKGLVKEQQKLHGPNWKDRAAGEGGR